MCVQVQQGVFSHSLLPLFDLQMYNCLLQCSKASPPPVRIPSLCVSVCVCVSVQFNVSFFVCPCETTCTGMLGLCLCPYLHLTTCRACVFLLNVCSSKRVCETRRPSVREGLVMKKEGCVLGRQQRQKGSRLREDGEQ